MWCVPALRVPLVHSLINHFRQNKVPLPKVKKISTHKVLSLFFLFFFFEEGSTTSHTLPLPKKLVTKLTRVMCTPHHTLTNCEKRKGQVSGGSCTSLPLFFWKKVVQHLTKWTRVMCTPHHTHWQTEKRKGGRSGGSYVLGPYLFFLKKVVQHLTKVNKVNKVNRVMCTSTHWQTEKQGGTGVLTS